MNESLFRAHSVCGATFVLSRLRQTDGSHLSPRDNSGLFLSVCPFAEHDLVVRKVGEESLPWAVPRSVRSSLFRLSVVAACAAFERY